MKPVKKPSWNGRTFVRQAVKFISLIVPWLCLLFFLQTEKSAYQYRGMFHALSTVLREEGPRALYKGWLPSVIGVVRAFFSTFSNTMFWSKWIVLGEKQKMCLSICCIICTFLKLWLIWSEIFIFVVLLYPLKL